MRRTLFAILTATLVLFGVTAMVHAQGTPPLDGPVVRILYFYSVDCVHCQAVQEEVLAPLQEQYGSRLDLRMLEISDPTNYELLVRVEEYFGVGAEERGLPTLVLDGQVLIGEEEIRQQLSCLLESCLAAGGSGWPPIPGLEEGLPSGSTGPLVGPPGGPGLSPCLTETVAACEVDQPIYIAYFYQVGCQECSRAEYDIAYVRHQHPQVIVEEFNINDDLPLAEWLARRVGREADLHTPALFIGDHALIGEGEITPQALEALVAQYAASGAPRVWADAQAETPSRIPGLLTVLFAGLVDGLNPCAFATLIFLISYLAASQRQGREILAAGGAFALGVFVAYLAVGFGLYRLLDVLRRVAPFTTSLNRWLYGLTALLCAVLAVVSFLDYLKARRGRIEDMALSLPDRLRQRVRAVIRTGQRMRGFVVATFITGLIVSLIELACTGQIYLPTIIYMTSVPTLRAQGSLYLLLYNVMFVLPLVIVFALTYFGTTSYQLGRFLQKHTATVKLGTALLFAALTVWLVVALV